MKTTLDDIRATLGDIKATLGDIFFKMYPGKWTSEIVTIPLYGQTQNVDSKVMTKRWGLGIGGDIITESEVDA